MPELSDSQIRPKPLEEESAGQYFVPDFALDGQFSARYVITLSDDGQFECRKAGIQAHGIREIKEMGGKCDAVVIPPGTKETYVISTYKDDHDKTIKITPAAPIEMTTHDPLNPGVDPVKGEVIPVDPYYESERRDIPIEHPEPLDTMSREAARFFKDTFTKQVVAALGKDGKTKDVAVYIQVGDEIIHIWQDQGYNSEIDEFIESLEK